jgi:hypothetical protein
VYGRRGEFLTALSMGASFFLTNKCSFSADVRKNDDHFEILVKEIMGSKSSSPRNYRLTSRKIYSKCNSGVRPTFV